MPLPDGGRRRLLARGLRPAPASRRPAARDGGGGGPQRRGGARPGAAARSGMLMDTASVGVATYDPARGWLRPRGPRRRRRPRRRGGGRGRRCQAAAAAGRSARDLVEPGSLPEYERLQRALRAGRARRGALRRAPPRPRAGAGCSRAWSRARWPAARTRPRW
ncbi:MAG: hypothetical protein MZW92_72095 [Comamonadaceae bacterium]|nr:hypothetical protein [Comamonadaceae bacterium]